MEKIVNYEQSPLTREAIARAYESLSKESAFVYMKANFPIRTIDETICEAVGYYNSGKSGKTEWKKTTHNEARRVLRGKLGNIFQTAWLIRNEKRDIEKKTVMRIALSLEFDPASADFFLKRCWLDGFYMRDVEDIIYVFALRNGWSYVEAEEWIGKYAFLSTANTDFEIDENEIEDDNVTIWLKRQFDEEFASPNPDPETLRTFIKKNEKYFGNFRRRLYDSFKKYYDDIEEYRRKENEEYIQFENDRKSTTMEDVMHIIGASGLHELKEGKKFSSIILKRMTEKIPVRQDLWYIINKKEKSLPFSDDMISFIEKNNVDDDIRMDIEKIITDYTVSNEITAELNEIISKLNKNKTKNDVDKEIISKIRVIVKKHNNKWVIKDDFDDLMENYDLEASVRIALARIVSTYEIKNLAEVKEHFRRDMEQIISKYCIQGKIKREMVKIVTKHEKGGSVQQVDRKFFILAWLAHEEDGGVARYAKNTKTVEAALENHLWALNDILGSFGLSRLDARHPLDWVVMNALYCAHCANKSEEDEVIENDLFDNVASRLGELFEALEEIKTEAEAE